MSRNTGLLHRRRARPPAWFRLVSVPVSRVSDRGLVWVVVAGALAVTGRFGRRAATRALLSAGLASAVSNGAVKLLARRRRPVAFETAARIQRLRTPTSSSFPSGHTATAFGFAAGAAQELPAVGIPLFGVAGLVGFSRVHTRLHHPSDVLVGAALGVGAALSTRRLWPVAPRQPAEVPSAARPADLEPSGDGGGVVVVVNAVAGSGAATAEELRKALPAAEVVEVTEPDGLERALDEAAQRAAVLGVAGGDGTVNSAATVAAKYDRPLLVVPGGTLNHFAHALGLSTVDDVADAVRGGRAGEVDLGLIDGHPFVNTASIGSYVDLVDARERFESKIGKWPALVLALVRVLRRAEPVTLEIDGRRQTVWMVFVGNCRYHPAGFGPSWRERLDDGQLDIRIVDAGPPWSRARLLVSVLTGRLARSRVYEQRYVAEMQVRSLDGPIRLARDGETFDGSEVFAITKAERPLRVYVVRS